MLYRGLSENVADLALWLTESPDEVEQCLVSCEQQPGRMPPQWMSAPVTELRWHCEMESQGIVPVDSVLIDSEGLTDVKAYYGELRRLTPPWTRLIEPGMPRPLHQQFGELVKRGQRSHVEKLVRSVVPELQSLQILADGDRPYLAIELSDGRGVVPVSLAGDGIQALLRVALGLGGAPGGVVLIEEPEVHQHPGALLPTAAAILAARRAGIQVVLTTHSLELIDALVGQASEEDLADMALFLLGLEDGVLRAGRYDGELVRYSRSEIMDDLR